MLDSWNNISIAGDSPMKLKIKLSNFEIELSLNALELFFLRRYLKKGGE